VTDFLVNLFKVSDPSEARGNAVTAREVLDEGASRIQSDLAAQSEVQARLAEVMARVYLNLGLYRDAEGLAQQSLELRRRVLGPLHPDTLLSLNLRGVVAVQQGDVAGAERAFRQASDGATTVLGENNARTLTFKANVAGAMAMQGRAAEAERLERDILNRRRQVLGSNHQETLQSINNLATVLMQEKKNDEAEALLREGLAVSQRTLGTDHPETLLQFVNLGELLQQEGKFAEAESYYRSALGASLRVLTPRHPDTVYVQVVLAGLLNESGRFQEAEVLLREAIRNGQGGERAVLLLADSLMRQRRFAEAERLLSAAYTRPPARGDAADSSADSIVEGLVALYDAWGKPAKAAEWRAKQPKPAAPTPVK